MDVDRIISALQYLEGKLGTTPSTREISREAGCSEATAIKYLQYAVAQDKIIQRDGRYMTLAIAAAYDAQRH